MSHSTAMATKVCPIATLESTHLKMGNTWHFFLCGIFKNLSAFDRFPDGTWAEAPVGHRLHSVVFDTILEVKDPNVKMLNLVKTCVLQSRKWESQLHNTLPWLPPSSVHFVYDSGCIAAADPVLSWEIGRGTDGNQAHAVHSCCGPRWHRHLHSAGLRQERQTSLSS